MPMVGTWPNPFYIRSAACKTPLTPMAWSPYNTIYGFPAVMITIHFKAIRLNVCAWSR
jgi:hypothetical protein